MNNIICKRIKQSIELKQNMLMDTVLLKNVLELATAIANCIKNDGKLVLCGNGGSASDALHFAGEIVGRFQNERNPWPAVVLNADVATLTAIANDYGYDDVFARQTEAHIRKGDVFIGITTSGNSANVLKAAEVAKEKQALIASLTGRDGGKISQISDYSLIVRDDVTARIQECHIMLIHILCELIEEELINE